MLILVIDLKFSMTTSPIIWFDFSYGSLQAHQVRYRGFESDGQCRGGRFDERLAVAQDAEGFRADGSYARGIDAALAGEDRKRGGAGGRDANDNAGGSFAEEGQGTALELGR